MSKQQDKKPKKGQYSKRVVALILIVALLFSAAVIITFWHTGAEPSTLVSCFFGTVIGELWLLAGIKKKKLDTEKEDKKEGQDIYEEGQKG